MGFEDDEDEVLMMIYGDLMGFKGISPSTIEI